MDRKIIFGKMGTHDGERRIDVYIDPFIENQYEPAAISFEIYKEMKDKLWHVRKKWSVMEKGHFITKKEYCGSGELKKCKQFCKEELELYILPS